MSLLTAFGQARTRLTPSHALIAPDGHVRTQLPGWTNTAVVVLISAQLGAKFTQYLAHTEVGGEAAPTEYERLVFVVLGEVRLESRTLKESDYVYLPAGSPATLRADAPATLCVFERHYLPLPNVSSLLRYLSRRGGWRPFTGKRGADDVSTVAAAFSVELSGNTVLSARLAYGGVAATPVRAYEIEVFLRSKPWNARTVSEAASRLRSLFTPLSDLRGSAEYRRALVGNLFEKFFFEHSGVTEVAA